MKERVEQALYKIRQYLQGDGGDAELVEITESGVVRLKLLAPLGQTAYLTSFHDDIEAMLKEDVPEVTGLELV